jgi:hypothetical protein
MENKFDVKLAKIFGIRKITGLDKFSLFGGGIGLIADTIGIAIFAHGLFVPSLPKPNIPPEGGLLITALLEFYFLSLIIWFMIRFERAKAEAITGEELDIDHRTFDDVTLGFGWGVILVPLIGVIIAALYEDTRVIFFLSIFISFLPVTLWIFILTTNPWMALGIGIFGGAFLSQYATFFALILDKFFH